MWEIRLAPGERWHAHRHVLDYFWTAVNAGSSRQHTHDGTVRDPRVLDLLRTTGMPVTMFLNAGPVREDAAYFDAIRQLGNTVNTHTLTHPRLPSLSRSFQPSVPRPLGPRPAAGVQDPHRLGQVVRHFEDGVAIEFAVVQRQETIDQDFNRPRS